jgi:hypothetical protein
VVYYVAGGGGAELRAVSGDWFTAYGDSVYHFLKVQIDDYRLLVDAIDRDGVIFDSYEIDHCVMPAAPEITSAPVTEAFVNVPYSYDVVATGNPPPTYALLVAPPGMSIDEITGAISWTPTAVGDYDVAVEAHNSEGTDNQAFSIHVEHLTTLEVRVASGTDDAEERASGSMYLTSSDLEPAYDNDD